MGLGGDSGNTAFRRCERTAFGPGRSRPLRPGQPPQRPRRRSGRRVRPRRLLLTQSLCGEEWVLGWGLLPFAIRTSRVTASGTSLLPR